MALPLSPGLRRLEAPGTGRRVVQDAATETNQLFLLDISDLSATSGIPWPISDSATVR